MSIFSKGFDEALGSNSGIFLDSPNSTSIFSDGFDSVYNDSIAMPYDDIIGSFLTRKTVDPFEEEEDEMGFGQIEPRVPSRAMPGSGFTTAQRLPRQDTAELGAITEVDRNVELFKQIGLNEEFEEAVAAEDDDWGFDDVIEPVFDFLSVGNYSVAGGLEEYLLTGSPIAGLQQAGEEFLNAIGIDQEGARRTTFADIFEGKRGETALTMDDANPYAVAAAGFVADVLLDPTTWFGFGLGKVAVGIGKLDEVAGAATRTRRISDLVTNSEAGKTYRRLFMPNSLMKGLKEGYQAEEIADTINRLGGDQGTKAVTAEDVKEGTVDFMAQQIRKDSAISLQTVALRENILKVAADMNEGELRLVGAYLDQPDVVQGLISQLKVDDATKQVISKGVAEWKDMFNKIFEEEEAVGLLDKAQFRANYSAGMEPVTELSRAIVENMFKVRFGKDAGSAMYEKATQDGIATITENGIMKASYAKKYPTLESRLQDLVPTETNAALMATRRGMESIKKVNTQKFYDTIISDTRIAVPIDQVVAENLRDPTHQMLKESGMAIWKAPALSVRKQTKQAKGEDNIYYAIPSAMKEQLDDMTKLITGSDDTNVLVSTFRQVQGLWKSYALLSPGYHMRNLYSNIFNNYLAGVTNPKRYAEAMLLQVGDTKSIGSRAVRSKIERILGGRRTAADYKFDLPDGTRVSGADIKQMADERGVTQAGMIYNESDLGIGEELMTNLQLREGKPKTTDISEGLADWGDRSARIANVSQSLFGAVQRAGGDLTEEQAQKTAEAYDVIARAWAWKNWKTPEEWYENRIREIKAYTVPTAGVPEAGSGFLHQTSIPGISKVDYSNPNFQKAAEGTFFKDEQGILPVFLHGTNYGARIRKEGEIDPTVTYSQYMGPGFYMTMDFLPYAKERGPQVTTGYMLHQPMADVGWDPMGVAAYQGQLRAQQSGVPGASTGETRGFYESIPELADEMKRFGHDDLLPKQLISGSPWDPVGPSPEQLQKVRQRAGELLDEIPEGPLKTKYRTYILARQQIEEELAEGKAGRGTSVYSLPTSLKNVEKDFTEVLRKAYDEYDIEDPDWEAVEGVATQTATGELDLSVVPKFEYARQKGERYVRVKPPEDEVLREIVALERYENQWGKRIIDLKDQLNVYGNEPEVLGFHWFAKKPYALSMVSDDGRSFKALRMGEEVKNPSAQTGQAFGTLGRMETTFSKEAFEHEIENINTATAETLASIYTNAAMEAAGNINIADWRAGFEYRQLEAMDRGHYGRSAKSMDELWISIGSKRKPNVKGKVPKAIARVFKSDEDLDLFNKDVFTTKEELDRYTELAIKYVGGKSGKVDGRDVTVESIVDMGRAFGNLEQSKGLGGNQQIVWNDLYDLHAPSIAEREAGAGGVEESVKAFFSPDKDPSEFYDYFYKHFNEQIEDDWVSFWDGWEDTYWDEMGLGPRDPSQKELNKPIGMGQRNRGDLYLTRAHYLGLGTWSGEGFLPQAVQNVTGHPDSFTKYLAVSSDDHMDYLGDAARTLGLTGTLVRDANDEELFGKLTDQMGWGLEAGGSYAADWLVSQAMIRAGYDGITHAGGTNDATGLFHQVGVAYKPNQIKSIENVGSWDLSTPKFMEQHGEDGLYGAINFLDDGRADILVTEGANPTTYIHELAHLIRRTMLDEGDKDIIQRWILGGENQYTRVRAEMVEYATEAARMAPDAEIDIDEMATQLMERFVWTVDGEEKFARGFEQFLLEGITDKNAGRAMQGTFEYMKEMMDTVYDFSNGGRVGLTPDEETNYLFQNILGRGAETEPETMATARALLGTATSEKESFFSRAYGMLGDNMFTRANRNFGQQMENNSRLAHFITMMTTDKGKIKGNGLLNKKATGMGMNADEAAESVKRYLFDYGELTPFERDYMKTIIPFYTWMRKNIPLQFKAIAEHPERYAMVPKLQHNLESMSAEWEGIPTPDYFDDINAMRMPITSEALPLNDSGMPLYFAPDLPYGDLNRLNMKDMVSSMTPFLKTWAEIYPSEGYSFFLDSDIQDYQDQAAVAKFFGEEMELPFNEKTYHAIKTLLPPVGKAARLGERASEGKFTEQALREVLGLNFRSVDVDAVVRAKRFQRREVARAMKQRLIDKAKLMGFEDAIEDMQDDDWL